MDFDGEKMAMRTCGAFSGLMINFKLVAGYDVQLLQLAVCVCGGGLALSQV